MNINKRSVSEVALITGASHGIGLEVCRQLSRRGMTVILTARELAKAEAATRPLVEEGLDVRPYVLDVTQDESVHQLAAVLERDYGKVDVLVNNAAAYVDWTEKSTTADLKASHDVFETNVFGSWRVSQLMLPLIRKSQHARIVNVSSGAGSHGEQQFGLTTNHGSVASYGISKAALNALTSKLTAELEDTGILVNAVCQA